MKRNRLKKFFIVVMMVTCILGSSIGVSAKSDSGATYISNKYGSLTGSTSGVMGYKEKAYNTQAKTTKKVSKIRAKLSVCYKKTGVSIGDGENTGWLANSKLALTCDYEMHHFYNKLTKKHDGFVNTKCVAYGTADAITAKAYAVYTSVTY